MIDPIAPMLIGEMAAPFDSPEHIFELKLDGIRCMAYLDGGTRLINKRFLDVSATYPELCDLHRQSKRAVRARRGGVRHDGRQARLFHHAAPFTDGRHDENSARRAKKTPVNFCAFDILYRDGELLTGRPLMERRALLEQTVTECERLSISRYIEANGVAFYNLVASQDLEGIVAKLKTSLYHPGKRTKEWIKVKNLKDDDFVVCGYIHKENNMTSLVLGQYRDGQLAYQGHVTLGVSRAGLQDMPRGECPFAVVPEGNEDAVWLAPERVCTVRYMERTESGHMRQPVFHGWRDDKAPRECILTE